MSARHAFISTPKTLTSAWSARESSTRNTVWHSRAPAPGEYADFHPADFVRTSYKTLYLLGGQDEKVSEVSFGLKSATAKGLVAGCYPCPGLTTMLVIV